jgi:hypothetical protein
MKRLGLLAVIHAILSTAALAAGSKENLRVSLSWGHQRERSTPYYIRLLVEDAEIEDLEAYSLEPTDVITDNLLTTQAGSGDIDGVEFTLRYPPRQIKAITNLHSIWSNLVARSGDDTIRRLKQDPAYRPDLRKLIVQMNEEATKGFSITMDQILQTKAFWIPSLGIYVAAGDGPASFGNHLRELEPYKGRRSLEQLRHGSEATYEQYAARWEDMGSPAYCNDHTVPPGHIVGITWDSALYKFGIDRGAGVWSDYGNPDRFRFRFDFGDVAKGIGGFWKSQRLEDGLPVITTTIEREGLHYEVEQYAYPLGGPPSERRGDIPMVLLQKLTVSNLQGQDKTVTVEIHHRREFEPDNAVEMVCRNEDGTFIFEESSGKRILFTVAGPGLEIGSCITRQDPKQPDNKRQARSRQFDASLAFELNGGASKEFIVKLASPIVLPDDRDKLIKLDYSRSRQDTLRFWIACLEQGAQFQVPEKVVNDLFRANLWHALRLPRRHGGQEEGVKIDLPYSNFAYDQHGAPWPVNQAVYVDYMIYGLRGYDDIATEELLTVFRSNQQPDGRVAGYANWGVYTPSMIYTVAKNYRLSGNRDAFDRLLPYTLKALDWCLGQIRSAQGRKGPAAGLISSPLNDLTGEGVWAFTQAYIYAAIAQLGKALEQIGHPRSKECLDTAEKFRESVERAFAAAAVRSPLVQLRDHTWVPYVPCDATKSGRLFEQWYPTDVDTGATHLLRLGALSADGELADYLLNDHEDNLYLHGWGMANEPVYNPQATAYLLRATPRKWLENGKRIKVIRVPTYYGELSMSIESNAASGRLTAQIKMPQRRSPRQLVLRFRHPKGKPMQSATVNGRKWDNFDAKKEWIVIPKPELKTYAITAHY